MQSKISWRGGHGGPGSAPVQKYRMQESRKVGGGGEVNTVPHLLTKHFPGDPNSHLDNSLAYTRNAIISPNIRPLTRSHLFPSRWPVHSHTLPSDSVDLVRDPSLAGLPRGYDGSLVFGGCSLDMGHNPWICSS